MCPQKSGFSRPTPPLWVLDGYSNNLLSFPSSCFLRSLLPLYITSSSSLKIPSNFSVIMAASASSFSATKILQPLNSTRSTDNNKKKTLLGNQLKDSSFFLGSAKKLYMKKPFSSQNSQRRSKGVLAVSEVVKDKKLNIDSSLSNLVLAFFDIS